MTHDAWIAAFGHNSAMRSAGRMSRRAAEPPGPLDIERLALWVAGRSVHLAALPPDFQAVSGAKLSRVRRTPRSGSVARHDWRR